MMGMNFCALDVETANEDRGSICQVGLVKVEAGVVVDEWETLVDPEDDFNDFNTDIHGITARDVAGAPTFPEMLETLRQRVDSASIVSHSWFDRGAFSRCYENYGTDPLNSLWLDSIRIAKHFNPGIEGGYGLRNLCQVMGIDLDHHNALSDAKAAAEVVLRCAEAGEVKSFAQLSEAVPPMQPRRRRTDAELVHFESDEAVGSLEGETVLFTGKLWQPKSALEKVVRDLGATVVSGASKKVTLLVVGVQDKKRTKGFAKSSKHRKMEALIKQGCDVRIVDEQSFMVALS